MIDSADVKASAFPVLETLVEWGATDISVVDGGDSAKIEFRTPLPGEQPIRSYVNVNDRGVTRSTLRLGGFDGSAFKNHPSHSREETRRLKKAIEAADPPAGGDYTLDFGDFHWNPRPHVRFGWPFRPTGEKDDVIIEEKILLGGDEPVLVDEDAFADFMVRAGREVEKEFEREFLA